jgi:hypothetical protein
MIRCVMVLARNGIPDAEVEDWEEILDGIDGEPELIEPIEGWAPYTHAYRMPDRSVYLVALVKA